MKNSTFWSRVVRDAWQYSWSLLFISVIFSAACAIWDTDTTNLMAIDLAADDCWAILIKQCPAIANIDLARLTLDIDGAMEDIANVVDAVFKSEVAALA